MRLVLLTAVVVAMADGCSCIPSFAFDIDFSDWDTGPSAPDCAATMDCGLPWTCETQRAYVLNQSISCLEDLHCPGPCSGNTCSTTVEACPLGTHCMNVGFSHEPCVADDDSGVVDAAGSTDADAGVDVDVGDAAADDSEAEADGGG